MPETKGQGHGIGGDAFKDAQPRPDLPGVVGERDDVAFVKAELFEGRAVQCGDKHVLFQLFIGDRLGVEGRDGRFGRAGGQLADKGHGHFLVGKRAALDGLGQLAELFHFVGGEAVGKQLLGDHHVTFVGVALAQRAPVRADGVGFGLEHGHYVGDAQIHAQLVGQVDEHLARGPCLMERFGHGLDQRIDESAVPEGLRDVVVALKPEGVGQHEIAAACGFVEEAGEGHGEGALFEDGLDVLAG